MRNEYKDIDFAKHRKTRKRSYAREIVLSDSTYGFLSCISNSNPICETQLRRVDDENFSNEYTS